MTTTAAAAVEASRSGGRRAGFLDVHRRSLCPLYVDSSHPMRARGCRGAGWIGFDPNTVVEIQSIANAIGNAAAQSSAMNQNARGPSAP